MKVELTEEWCMNMAKIEARAEELHEGCRMPMEQARELAASEASPAAGRVRRLRAALTKIVDTYDAYRRRGVVPSPVEYADVIVAIEQARAAMKEKP